jgi:hypothetical protein
VHGEQVDEALRCVLADAQVEEVAGGQAATAATAAETTAGGWYALVAPQFAGAVAEDLGAIGWPAKYVVPMVKIVTRCLGNEATVDRAGLGSMVRFSSRPGCTAGVSADVFVLDVLCAQAGGQDCLELPIRVTPDSCST